MLVVSWESIVFGIACGDESLNRFLGCARDDDPAKVLAGLTAKRESTIESEYYALSGLRIFSVFFPRAFPWADILCPFRADKRNLKSQIKNLRNMDSRLPSSLCRDRSRE